MGRVFNEADYQRRLQELDSSEITLGQELSDIGSGWAGLMNPAEFGSNAIGTGPLNARKDMLAAKKEALRQARKAMISAIRATEREQRFNSVVPTEVEEIATGAPGEQLVKVP